MAKNHIRDALLALAVKLRLPFAGIDADHRVDVAGACLAAADLVPEVIAKDIPGEDGRFEVTLLQFMARELLGALFCADLVNDGEMPAEEQENLVALVSWIARSMEVEARAETRRPSVTMTRQEAVEALRMAADALRGGTICPIHGTRHAIRSEMSSPSQVTEFCYAADQLEAGRGPVWMRRTAREFRDGASACFIPLNHGRPRAWGARGDRNARAYFFVAAVLRACAAQEAP